MVSARREDENPIGAAADRTPRKWIDGPRERPVDPFGQRL
jgi:hypothetical protein